jgi:hypothetical protein
MEAVKEGYNKWTLQPRNPQTAIIYREFTRSHVQKTYPFILIYLLLLVFITLAVSLASGDFKQLRETLSPNLVYFFLVIGLVIVSLPLYFIGKKFHLAIELMIPCYVIYYIVVLLPVIYESPR